MSKLLCWIGIHEWWNSSTNYMNDDTVRRSYRCLRCGKKKVDNK